MASKLRPILAGFCLVACAHGRGREEAPITLPEPPPMKDDRPLVSEAGRVFFAKAYEKFVQLLWVRRSGAKTYLEIVNDMGSSSRFEVTSESGGALTGERDGATLTVRLRPDGSFSGELKRSWGEITTYVPIRPLPVTDELAQPVGFVGFSSSGARYRMLLSARGDEVTGIARFPQTRVDLTVRGTLDRIRRRMPLEEVDGSGKVVASLDLTVLWLPPTRPEEPVFPVLAGARTEREVSSPLRLHDDHHDDYPRRVVSTSGAGLFAQESYEEDCGVVADMVFPAPEGVDTSVAKKLEPALQMWMQRAYEPFTKGRHDDAVMWSDRPASFEVGTRVTANDCKAENRRRGVFHADTYSALPLGDDWIVLDITHFTDLEGVTDAGVVRSDCVVVDMAKGSVSEPKAYFSDEARARVRASAQARLERQHLDEIQRLVTAGLSPVEAAREVAHEGRGVDVHQRPLCIGASDVRLKAPKSVFGRQVDIVWTRKEFAALLPAGPLRKHVEP